MVVLAARVLTYAARVQHHYQRDEDGFYLATVPELRGCHTQAKSLDTLMKRTREAIDLCLEVAGETPTSSQFVGVQRILVEI